jgi:hypothetical protein
VLFLDVTDLLAALDAQPTDDVGRGGAVPALLRRVDVGFGNEGPGDPPRPEVLKFLRSTCSVVSANEQDEGSISIIPILSSSPDSLLSIENDGTSGMFDIYLESTEEIGAFSFGLEPSGECDTAIVVDVEPGSSLPDDVAFFFKESQSDDSAMTVAAILSLSEEPVVLAAGERHHVARVHMCGSVFNTTGCDLDFTGELGDPTVLLTLGTRAGVSIAPSTEGAPIPTGFAFCFKRGDANIDGRHDIADPLRILAHIFLDMPTLCEDALDTDDSGELDVTDATVLTSYLFGDCPPPPPPGLEMCGPDPTEDELGCEIFDDCRG